jgi:hypothetical protein
MKKADPAVLELLLAAEGYVNARNETDQTPLEFALLSCDVAATRTLLRAGAAPGTAFADDVSLVLARGRCPAETAEIERLWEERREP